MRVTALVALLAANSRTHSWAARRGILPSDRSRSRFTFRSPSSEPIRVTRPVAGHDQPHIRSPPMRLHQDPACGGRGSGGRDHSSYRLLRPWLGSVRPPGSARPVRVWKIWDCVLVGNVSGLLHHRALDDDAERDVLPQRHQQLARQGDDVRLLPSSVVGRDALLEPEGQRRLRLISQPQPGQFDRARP